MFYKKSAIIIVTVLHLTATSSGTDPTVKIGSTKITGERVHFNGTEVNQFLGIPYAEPPTGRLRFAPTKPLRTLPKAISAKKQPPACPQYTNLPFPWYANTTDQSEDCLYLNIWSPGGDNNNNNKAVMFWIHGGGFRFGSIRQEIYSGQVVAALGNIVVVGVNYRLGAFGFLTSETKDVPGNAGMWDLLEALRWVHSHIGAFGGDPGRVTLAGESAGAFAVGFLADSPLARGLFSRRVMQSGAAGSVPPTSRRQCRRMSQELAVRAGCADGRRRSIYRRPKEVVRCLRGINATVLSRLENELPVENLLTFAPSYGDAILPARSLLKPFAGELFIGGNKDDGTLLSTFFPSIFGFFGNGAPRLNKTSGKRLMAEMFQSLPLLGIVRNYYLDPGLPEGDSETVRDRLYASVADVVFFCPALYHAQSCARAGADVYFYQWVHRSSDSPWGPRNAVAHFTEVEFVFGRPLLHPERFGPDEVKISREMVRLWSEFVKSGKPDESWPRYNRDKLVRPIFGFIGGENGTEYGFGPDLKNCNFLRPFLLASQI